MSNLRSFVTVDDVETQSFDWGKLQWLTDPRVTGSQCMVSGIVTLDPGQGHARHNHPGCCENLFILEGEGEQMIEKEDVNRETRYHDFPAAWSISLYLQCRHWSAAHSGLL